MDAGLQAGVNDVLGYAAMGTVARRLPQIAARQSPASTT